ncbi:hypothetical protein C8R46DRAFT_1031287 [Mycena filopes]|nr:hypothetical protein C8R46DRAFT_1031287 [Mycena filopes]
MRISTLRRPSLLSLSLIPLLFLASPAHANPDSDSATEPPTNHGTGAAAGGLYPPGLQPLITRANVLLSTGQFSEGGKSLWRGDRTITPRLHPLLQTRHRATSPSAGTPSPKTTLPASSPSPRTPSPPRTSPPPASTPKKAPSPPRAPPSPHTPKPSPPPAPNEQKKRATATPSWRTFAATEAAAAQATRERAAQLWTACAESATKALRGATHAVPIRSLRVECALGAGDVEGAVGDMARLSTLLPPSSSSTALHALVFRLSYFLLPARARAANALKANPVCLPLHRLYKGLERGFAGYEKQEGEGDWRGGDWDAEAWGREEGGYGDEVESAMKEQLGAEKLGLGGLFGLGGGAVVLPDAGKTSPRWRKLLRGMCKGYTQLEMYRKGRSGVRDCRRWRTG